jgi:hypothetical protein
MQSIIFLIFKLRNFTLLGVMQLVMNEPEFEVSFMFLISLYFFFIELYLVKCCLVGRGTQAVALTKSKGQLRPSMVVNACNPSYLGSGDRRIAGR